MWEPVKQGGIIKNKMFNIYQTKGTQLSNEKSIYMFFLKTKGIIIIIRIFEMIATYV